MNIEAIKTAVTSKTARQILVARKHSPKVLFVAGTVGVIGATVLACRATLKVSDVLEKVETETGLIDRKEAFSVEDREKMKSKAKIKGALDIAKLYAPAVGLGAASIVALTGSHVIMTKRNGALAAAYATVHKAHDEYRKRVVDELGIDKDREFSLGVEEETVQEKTADGKTITKQVRKLGPNGMSGYAALFDENSYLHTREPGMNAHIIQIRQSWANDKLKANGHLFLNEVHDFLGLPRTKQGTIVGWVYDPKNPNHTGDNEVDFGVYKNPSEIAEAFVDGKEPNIWLDFNVDGPIWELI